MQRKFPARTVAICPYDGGLYYARVVGNRGYLIRMFVRDGINCRQAKRTSVFIVARAIKQYEEWNRAKN